MWGTGYRRLDWDSELKILLIYLKVPPIVWVKSRLRSIDSKKADTCALLHTRTPGVTIAGMEWGWTES
jgi:hypothetical protein